MSGSLGRSWPAVVAGSLGLVLGGGRTPGAAQDAPPAARPATACPTTTEDENAAIARRGHEDLSNPHALPGRDEILAPAPAPDSATIAANPGPRGVRSALLTAVPDVRHTREAVITEGDFVVVRSVAPGTHEGERQGDAPPETRVSGTGITLDRLECGRIAALWSEVEALGRHAQRAGSGTATPAAGTPRPEPGPNRPQRPRLELAGRQTWGRCETGSKLAHYRNHPSPISA